MEDNFSIIRFFVTNFFALVINARPFYPISTSLVKIVDSLISSEPEPDKKHRERLKWIYDNTHSRVNKPIAIVELAVFKNLDKGLNREISLGSDDFLLIDLYRILDEVSLELSRMVIEIAKKYSIDIPLNVMQSNQKINFGD
jgi:hypothetical protein